MMLLLIHARQQRVKKFLKISFWLASSTIYSHNLQHLSGNVSIYALKEKMEKFLPKKLSHWKN